MLTIQFLEPNPRIQRLSREEVVQKLHRAGQVLPITHVLIGWQLPEGLEVACRKECENLGVNFLRWQPYLTSDGSYKLESDWQVENVLGQKVKGSQDLPEFTHICPNNPAAMNQNLKHLEDLVKTGMYDGIFLDRIRFPSPGQKIPDDLGCFCKHCTQAASKQDLDIDLIRQHILQAKTEVKKGIGLVETIFSGNNPMDSTDREILERFFTFRQVSISTVVCDAAKVIHDAGMEVGLDCFSPSLTNLVGQNLNILGEYADWIKIMTYGRTLAPAGLPFEYRGILDFLVGPLGMEEKCALEKLEELSGIPLPSNRQDFESIGFGPLALKKEIERGNHDTRAPILAGIELVEDPHVIPLNENEWEMHMEAIKIANPAGLSISWDLLKIPDTTLKKFERLYNKLWN
jgi:hypothetical protein